MDTQHILFFGLVFFLTWYKRGMRTPFQRLGLHSLFLFFICNKSKVKRNSHFSLVSIEMPIYSSGVLSKWIFQIRLKIKYIALFSLSLSIFVFLSVLVFLCLCFSHLGTPLTQLTHVNDKTDTGQLAGKYLIIAGA